MTEQVGFMRNMGLFMAVMIGIGATMGPGVVALPGELAHMVGPLGIFVYLIMGLMTVFTALNYSELSAAIPLAGGGYSFTSRTVARRRVSAAKLTSAPESCIVRLFNKFWPRFQQNARHDRISDKVFWN